MYHSFIHGTQLGAPVVALGCILTSQVANKTISIGIRPATPRLVCEGGNFYAKFTETVTKLVPIENTALLDTLLRMLVVIIIHVITPHVLNSAAIIIIIATVRDLGKVFPENLLETSTVGEMFLSKLASFEQVLILGTLRTLIAVFICILTVINSPNTKQNNIDNN